MSTEDAVSDPKEPEGTEVSTETTDNESVTAAGGTAESADAGTSADAKAVDTDTAAVSAEGSSKTDTDKSPSGEAEKTVAIDKTSAAEAEDDKNAGSDKTVRVDKAPANETAEAEKAEKADARAKPPANKSSALTRGRVLFVAAAVLLIAAMVAVGILAFQATDRRQELDRRAAATKAACDFGHDFATYTGDQVDDYLSRLDRSATGEWKKLVAQIGPDLKARFAERQVSSSAGDVQCGYESGSDNKARVVLIIDQSFTTAESTTPGEVKVAANVDMEKVGDRWMVANFDTPMVRQ